MDIQILLWFQNWREASGNVLTPFMEWISSFVDSVWPIMAVAVIYWAINKRMGRIFFRSMALGEVVNGVTKLTACVYRPWIRSAEITPVGSSSGYSFPSGHTTRAAYFFATGAGWAWKKPKWMSFILFVPVILVMISRMYLGLHTIQDVSFGLILTLVVVTLSYLLERKTEEGKVTDLEVLIGALLIVLVAYIYITVKSYPMDTDAAGSLIVDPEKKKPDTFAAFGFLIGFAIGNYIEKRWIRYEMPKSLGLRIAMAVVFLVPFYFMYNNMGDAFKDAFGKSAGKMLSPIFWNIYLVAVVPGLMKRISPWVEKKILYKKKAE